MLGLTEEDGWLLDWGVVGVHEIPFLVIAVFAGIRGFGMEEEVWFGRLRLEDRAQVT